MTVHLFKVVENYGGEIGLTSDRVSFYTIEENYRDEIVRPFWEHLKGKNAYRVWMEY